MQFWFVASRRIYRITRNTDQESELFVLKTFCLLMSALSLALEEVNHVFNPSFSIYGTYVCLAKWRKYRGIFKMKSREKTRQVMGNWSQQLEHKQVTKRRNQMSGKVNCSCWHGTSVANAPLVIRWRSSSLSMSWNWRKVGMEVTVTGRWSESHLTFARGKLHTAE